MESKVCSKCQRELSIDNFHKNGFDRKGNQKYRGYCKDCANALETQRYKKKKSFVNQQKEVCAKCGENRFYVLDFHHKDKEEKEFTIGRLKKGSLSVIQDEIDKCVVLCANCHREFHFLEAQENMTIEEYLLK